MTTTDALDRLSLRSPDALISAIPYLLGFRPCDSAVVVWLRGGRILLTQRLDLPTRADQHEAWHAAVWAHAAVADADELVVVLVTPDASDEMCALAHGIAQRAGEREIGVRDLIRLDADRWWSLLCDDVDCCPAEGRGIDPSVQDAIAAEFTILGCAPVSERADLVRSMARDEVGAFAVEAALAEVAEPSDVEAWRDERIDDIRLLLSTLATDHPARERTATALLGLVDVRVRDTVLWEVSRWNATRLDTAFAQLCAMLRVAPPGLVAPVATCTALVSWQLGDGARAHVALDRAVEDDPGYSLAGLIRASLVAGMPPRVWREAMRDLTRAICRHGAP